MTAVIVLAKECVPGRVKTRLCPPFTPAESARIAAASLADTLSLARRMPVDRRILAFDGIPDFDTTGFEVRPQVAGSLDVRIGAALDDCAEPVLLIGMDTPQLRMSDVGPVFRSWDAGASADEAWLGLAPDGGYWALALSTPRGAAVRGVPMSRPDTAARQRAQLVRTGHRVHELASRTDIDDVQSLRRVLPEAPAD
jgi:glycosyltransferase A (GT-A) superfamily protein (DUF2064 family)